MRSHVGWSERGVGGFDGQAAAIRHRVLGIDREVEDGGLELVGIDRGLPHSRGEVRLDRDGLADRPAHQIRHALDQAVDVDGFDLERMLAGIGEEAVDQADRAMRGLARGREIALHALVRLAQPQRRQVDVAQNGGEQVVEVVGDPAGEPSDRLHLLRLPQRVLGELALRDLLVQLRIGHRLAARAPQGDPCQHDHRDGGGHTEQEVAEHRPHPAVDDAAGLQPDDHVDAVARQPPVSDHALDHIERRVAAQEPALRRLRDGGENRRLRGQPCRPAPQIGVPRQDGPVVAQ